MLRILQFNKVVFLVSIGMLLFSCKEMVKEPKEQTAKIEAQTTIFNNDDFEKARIQDSLRVIKLRRVELEIEELLDKGIIGQWRTNHKGYKTIISLIRKQTKYHVEIKFIDSKTKPTINQLKKSGNNFFVLDSNANEFYTINKEGNLELWDDQGYFTNGYNIYPGSNKKTKPTFNIDKIVGENIFNVTGIFSQSNPKSLEGTNNEYWIVYFLDLNTTFKVKKSTMKIKKAVYGQISKLK